MKTSILFALLTFLFACNEGNEPMTDIQKEALRKEATQVIGQVFSVLAEGKGESRMALCENSDDFCFTLPEGIFTWDGLNDYVVRDFNEAEKETLVTKKEQYILLDPSCFIYVWQGSIDIVMKNGDIIRADDYYSTWTFRKSNDEWKMVNGHESSKEPFYRKNPASEE